MKTAILFISILFTFQCFCQISNYNHFPTMQPSHILDDKLEDISFAFGLRVLESDYNGPLIRLRRSSDNAEQDFGWADNDLVDVAAIDTWRVGSNVFVVTWYDQSGLGRDAIQNTANFQPRFFTTDPNRPYFVGDGANDSLIIQTSIQTITNLGKNGSVFGVFFATDRSDSAFGVLSGNNRWLTHINWSNEQCYFDAGSCCQAGRSFVNNLPTNTSNPGSLGIWDQYSFIRRDDPANTAVDRRILKLGGIEKVNQGYTDGFRCTLNYNFGICAVTTSLGNTTASHSNTRFIELIMYAEGKSNDFITLIEEDQIACWNL